MKNNWFMLTKDTYTWNQDWLPTCSVYVAMYTVVKEDVAVGRVKGWYGYWHPSYEEYCRINRHPCYDKKAAMSVCEEHRKTIARRLIEDVLL